MQIADRSDAGMYAMQIDVSFFFPHLQKFILGKSTENPVHCAKVKVELPK